MKLKISLTLIFIIGLSAFFYLEKHKSSVTTVLCETTKGPLEIQIHPSWSPKGAERFLQLVDEGFYQDIPLFRCVENFLCQFGATLPKPESKAYPAIEDDPPNASSKAFKQGFLSFAGSGPNSRSTHVFILLGENVRSLGKMPWETAFGSVSPESFEKTVKKWTTAYGEMPPWGQGPDPQKIASPEGRQYLQENFPNLDYIQSCRRK